MDKEYQNGFPWRLENGNTICHFQCKEHLQKYLDRYKLKAKQCNIKNKDGESFEPRKKHKKNIQSKSRKSSNRSTSTVRKRKPHMDSTGNITGNTAKCE